MGTAAVTSHAGRLYALALALVAFFLVWAVVAAHPWASTATDVRVQALAVREAQLRREARAVHRVVVRRWAVYHRRLTVRRAQIAAARTRAAAVQAAASAAPAAPAAVQVVNLPPLTITRTS